MIQNLPFYPVPIRTIHQNGEWMFIHPNGCIERQAPCSVRPSPQWRVTGARVYPQNGRGNGAIIPLVDLLTNPGSIPWTWRSNGKQRTHICDYDHGAFREWGSPSHLVY